MINYTIYFLDKILHRVSTFIKSSLWFFYKEIDTTYDKSLPTIDIVIPLAYKDLNTVFNCVNSLKKFSMNPIGKIFIVAENNDQIIDFANSNNLIHIPEDSISKLNSEEIKTYINCDKRLGWLKQQLIKLNVDQIPSITNNVLLMDSDTILCKNQFFCTNEYSILKFSDEYHFRYKLASAYLLNEMYYLPISYISHHQLINLKHLEEMRLYIEKIKDVPFNLAFLDAYKKYNIVSEYELYAQFVLKNYPHNYKLQYWFNYNKTINSKVKKITKRAHSYSFHNYNT